MTRYELLDRIGVGGMAEIFRGKAVAAGGFEKPVAIKRILPHLSQDRRFVELLIAEAKVLSLLKHRNIVQIYDVGLGDDGQYFLVMEFVDGKDLGAVQRGLVQQRRRVPIDLVLHMCAEICEALEHAHGARAPDGKSMSLVHRDVSPSNVLLSRAGEVKLTDFGIAKRAESDVTQGGAVRGKFAYISPEQARNEHLDPRSDVFSVGILLWELACNRPLFSGLDDMAALRAVRDATVPRPSEIDPRLPPELDALVAAAVARDPARRHAGAGVFGQKLRALRYSLETTVPDPAAELARIVDAAEAQPQPRPSGPFDQESTVIQIRTADAFSARDQGASLSRARAVIDRFEEEETRLAQVSGDQLRELREGAPRDSSEMTAMKPPPVRPDPPPRAQFDPDQEPTSIAFSDNARTTRRTPGGALAPARAPSQPQPRAPRPPTQPPPVAAAAMPAPAPVQQQPQQPQPQALPRPRTVDRAPPQVAGFAPAPRRRGELKPWVMVVGALVMALIAYAITRALLS